MSLPGSPIESSPFHILSLDGGGICGAFVAGFIAEIEARTGKPFGEHFDLIAGTSTGGIIAAALAFREPASKIEDFYRERGPLIFRRAAEEPVRWWIRRRWRALRDYPKRRADRLLTKRTGVDFAWIMRSKYGNSELRNALADVFGERTLGEARNRLVIPSINLTTGQPKVFKTPHLDDLYLDAGFKVVDVVMATTAAPTYFPHTTIQPGSAYADGGLWANNPVMVAIVEAMKLAKHSAPDGEEKPIDLSNTHVLSLGTGRLVFFADPPAGGGGIAWWAMKSRLTSVILQSQSQGSSFQANYLLGKRHTRIDFEVPDDTWNIDSTCYIEQMIHKGHERATALLGRLKAGPLAYSARPFGSAAPEVPIC